MNSLLCMRRAIALAIALTFANPPGATECHAAEETLALQRAKTIQSAVAKVDAAVVQLQPLGGAGALASGSPSARSVLSPTTGLLLSAEGEILSSSYGLDPAPASLIVTYADGSRSSARVVAVDHNRALALVQASRPPKTAPPTLEWATAPRVGETAIAVGRTFRADQPNLAVGIVSALDRLYGRAVQTDAAASPANYGGPLVDLGGRVIGVLTPLAPAGEAMQAGVGWYDSGIGFAVPAAKINDRLARLRAGEALHRGRAGIAFASGNPHVGPAKIMTVHPGGPADRAGLKPGDIVQMVNGRQVACPKDYRFAAETLDAGQQLKVELLRGTKTITAQVTLARQLSAYQHAYLGLIAARSDPAAAEDGAAPGAAGVELAYVVPDGPADKAGVIPGDRLLAVNDTPVATRAQVLQQLAAVASGEKVHLSLLQQGGESSVTATSVSLNFKPEPLSKDAGKVDETEIVVPSSDRRSQLLRPSDSDGRLPMLVWLGGQMAAEPKTLSQSVAARGAIVVIIQQPDKDATRQSQQAYLNDLLGILTARPDVDPNRIAIGGEQRAAPLALRIGLSTRDRLAGVVLRNWPSQPPRAKANEPETRLGVLQLTNRARDKAAAKQLNELGFPVHSHEFQQQAAGADALANWLTGLDRF